ncbi:MAG: signal peptide peptidase SppA [Terriglobia bacterium]
MKKGWIALIVVVVGALLLLAVAAPIILLILSIGGGSELGVGERIVVIRIDGVISASGGDGLLVEGGTTPEIVLEQLREADEDDRVKAVLVRINSPGGTPAAAQEIFRELKRTEKPVVTSVGDIAASAAYLLAAGTDRIVSSRASEVGSIGVIQVVPNLQELYTKIGVENQVITAGKFKDMFSGSRPLSEEERELLDQDIQIVYGQFIEDVAKGRRIPERKVRELATGQTFPGSEAIKLGLVDELGNYRDAVDLAAKMGKIKGEPELIEYGAPSLLELITRTLQGRTIDLRDLFLPTDLFRIPSSMPRPELPAR